MLLFSCFDTNTPTIISHYPIITLGVNYIEHKEYNFQFFFRIKSTEHLKRDKQIK